MVPYNGTATTTQKPQIPPPGVAHPPRPLPRPPPPPGGMGMSSPPPLSGDPSGLHHRQHHQQHMSMGVPGPHRQHQSGMNYHPLPPPPSPNGGTGPSLPPYHHPHHPPQQRHYPQHGHQQHSSQRPQHSAQHQQHTSQHQLNIQHQPRIHSQPQHHQQHPSQRPRSQNHPQKDPKDDHVFFHAGLNGDWQSDKDMQHRRKMIEHIVKLLKQRDKNASPEWLSKLPQMVKQLEVSLYRSAPSFEAYSDTKTLKNRLQLLAMEIARKTQAAKEHQSHASRRGSSERHSGQNHGQISQSHHHGSHPQQQPRQHHNSQANHVNYNDHQMVNQRQQQLAAQRQAHQQQNTTGRDMGRQMVHVNDINPMMNGSGGGTGGTSAQGSSQQLDPSSINPLLQCLQESPTGSGASDLNNSFLNSSHGSAPGISLNKGDMNGAPSLHGSRSDSINKSNPDWQTQTRIKHKQQRLLLLHHSSKCNSEPGQCRSTQFCADMKRLWKHMSRCTDHNCRVSHCFSSRSILSHYRKCKDAQCEICGPVRDTVRRTQTKSRPRPQDLDHPISQQPFTRQPSADPNFPAVDITYPPEPGGLVDSGPPLDPSMHVSNAHSPYQPNRHSEKQVAPQQKPPHHPNHRHSPNGPHPFPNDGSAHIPSSLMPNNNGTVATDNIFRPDHNTMSPLPPGQSGDFPMPRGTLSHNPSRPPDQSWTGRDMRNDPEYQKIKHKQQRLLLLRHASKCIYEDGKCPETPHCGAMKKLWKHIATCKDQNCKVQHCISSRYVLSHYRKCKEANCPACGPVRDAIKKSHDRDKDRPRVDHSYNSSQPPPMPLSNPSDLGMDLDNSSSLSHSHPPHPKRPKPNEDNSKFKAMQATLDLSSPTSGGMTLSLDKVKSEPARKNLMKAQLGDSKKSKTGSSKKDRSKPDSTSSANPKPVEDHSLINSFTIEQIETHILSLNRTVQLPPAKLKTKCLDILKGLQTHEHGWVFNTPVDPVELSLPDYFEIIKHPVDLGTIQKRLESGSYHAIDHFASDVRMTFDNAMTYNQEGSVVHNMAKELKIKFLSDHEKFLAQLKEEEQERRKNNLACTLCGCVKLLFEPPVFFCNGVNCPSKRIRRNSHYYVGGTSQYYWCNQCYNELDESAQIELAELSTKKGELVKKKNDEIHEESWVQCDSCERWIHQICGLFNARQNKEHRSEYCCPHCLIKNRKKNGGRIFPTKGPMAEALPRTKLSERLEKHVRKKVDRRTIKMSKEKAEAEKCSVEEARKCLDLGGHVTIRQVTSTDRKLEVRDRMKQRYAHKKYPDEFPFRCKCLLVFQNIDGVDVILFALYVYEHGENNPQPNQRTVYISYLDSIHFMRPRKMRTFIYHEILICYLDYAREKGFATAHIWACPPLKGDDYIFYAKPEDQKTPKDARLRQWYIDMLIESQKRGIVGKVTNMHELYFSNENIDATQVPYHEGDYFPGEAENVIKDLEDCKKSSSSGKRKKKKQVSSSGVTKSKSKTKNTRGGTRSTGIDEDNLAIAIDESTVVKSYKEGGRDLVMVKLGETIQPMKESFIVAFLSWSGAKKEDMVVPPDIEECRRKIKEDPNHEHFEKDVPEPDTVESSTRKRDSDGKLSKKKNSSFPAEGHHAITDEKGRLVKVIDDDLEEMDCEFFNNRQAFLNLCRGNHYQFDELRRAKHTSMMVLWHLHNRDAPKFVQQCTSCNREILTGIRYHCTTCTDVDLCEDCVKNPSTNRGNCSHKLEPIPVEGENKGQNNSGDLTAEQREERQRNIQLHIQLIEHASGCNSSQCQSSNCAKMKGFLKHGEQCKTKAAGGCKICKRIWTLLRIHAQQCKKPKCPIPQCIAIRERFRQLAKQQQDMDDRRRQEMNRTYRGV